MNNHNINHDQVCLAMWIAEEVTVEDIARTRELVKRLPEINKFKMIWLFVKVRLTIIWFWCNWIISRGTIKVMLIISD